MCKHAPASSFCYGTDDTIRHGVHQTHCTVIQWNLKDLRHICDIALLSKAKQSAAHVYGP